MSHNIFLHIMTWKCKTNCACVTLCEQDTLLVIQIDFRFILPISSIMFVLWATFITCFRFQIMLRWSRSQWTCQQFSLRLTSISMGLWKNSLKMWISSGKMPLNTTQTETPQVHPVINTHILINITKISHYVSTNFNVCPYLVLNGKRNTQINNKKIK